MIHEISNKVSNLENFRKKDNKTSDSESPSTAEPGINGDLKNNDKIEISGQQPVELPAEKIIEPVSGQNIDMQMLKDAYQGKAIRGKEEKLIAPPDIGYTSAVDEEPGPSKDVPAKEEPSLVDLLTSAYGKKETEVGKVIRMTV